MSQRDEEGVMFAGNWMSFATMQQEIYLKRLHLCLNLNRMDEYFMRDDDREELDNSAPIG